METILQQINPTPEFLHRLKALQTTNRLTTLLVHQKDMQKSQNHKRPYTLSDLSTYSSTMCSSPNCISELVKVQDRTSFLLGSWFPKDDDTPIIFGTAGDLLPEGSRVNTATQNSTQWQVLSGTWQKTHIPRISWRSSDVSRGSLGSNQRLVCHGTS